MLKGWKERTIGVESCTFYPYGLNDNVRKVGNISKCKDVNTLFHKQTRKFRNCWTTTSLVIFVLVLEV